MILGLIISSVGIIITVIVIAVVRSIMIRKYRKRNAIRSQNLNLNSGNANQRPPSSPQLRVIQLAQPQLPFANQMASDFYNQQFFQPSAVDISGLPLYDDSINYNDYAGVEVDFMPQNIKFDKKESASSKIPDNIHAMPR